MSKKLTFQEIILTLQQFWNDQGCMLMQAYDNEKGAGTMSPYTFLRAIGPEPWNAAYVEPSRRPADGRYGENPNRLYQHHQFQVVMKPSPSNIQELYLQSLELLGINPLEHDIRFVEDNWENPSTGSAGLGWEVWLDGMEITQFTYFQQVGGLPTQPVTAEVTYGLERLASYIQEVDSVYDIEWADGVKYGEISLILSMSILSTVLRSATKTCFWGILRGLKRKLSAVWTSIWCTQPMTMFSNARILLTSWMRVEPYL